MKKNIKTYDYNEFQKKEGITIPSSKEKHLEILKSFEGLIINRAEIIDGIDDFTDPKKPRLYGRYLRLLIDIERHINIGKHNTKQGKTLISNIEYIFRIGTGWKMYKNNTLVYDDSKVVMNEDVHSIAKQLVGLTIKKLEINKGWDLLTITFDNNATLMAYRHKTLSLFFSIGKSPQLFTLNYMYGRTDEIKYTNLSTESKPQRNVISDKKNNRVYSVSATHEDLADNFIKVCKK